MTRFREVLTRHHAEVAPWGMLTVASIQGRLPAELVFSRCSPEKGQVFTPLESIRRSQDDWLELKRQYEQQFELPMQNLLKQMPLNRTAPYSPIIRSLEDVIRRLGPRWEGVANRHVVIFSDLMEHTRAFSQYDSSSPITSFAQARAAISYIRDARIDLHHTKVTIFYLAGRPGNAPFQGKRHEQFWRDLIAYYGGQICDWVQLPMQENRTER